MSDEIVFAKISQRQRANLLSSSGELTILFWNAGRADKRHVVCALAEETGAQIIITVEHRVQAGLVLADLKSKVARGFVDAGASGNGRAQVFCKDKALGAAEIHNGDRVTVRKVVYGRRPFLLSVVHGLDVRNNDEHVRSEAAMAIAEDVRFARSRNEPQTRGSIIIGDFNMNPFDRPMNSFGGFNAMMTRSCASRGPRVRGEASRDLYYNPMWQLFGREPPNASGTIYDTSNVGPYGWSMFDQALINSELLEQFVGVEILTRCESLQISTQLGRPRTASLSDHFPIVLRIRGCNDD